MRLTDYFIIAGKDIRRQALRSLLTILALIISTVILVTMAALSIGGRQAITDQFGSSDALTAITVTPSQNSQALSPFGGVQEVNHLTEKLTDQTAESLSKLPHVTSVSARANIWEFHHFAVANSDKQFVAQAQGIGSDAPLKLAAGTLFESNDQKNVVILGAAYVSQLGGTPSSYIGKQIQITTQKGYRGEGASIPPAAASKQISDTFNQTVTTLSATIIGVTDKGPDQSSLFIPMGWAHAIRTSQYNEGADIKKIDQLASDGYTAIRLSVDDTANVKSVSSALQAQGYGQISTLAQVEQLQQFSTTMWVILGAVAAIAIVAAALGVANTMLMTVSEQRYMVGVWRAVGARKKMVTRLFLIQASLLGMIGGAIGVGLSFVTTFYVNMYVSSLLTSQGLALTNIAQIPWWLAGGALLITIVFATLAGLYPAYRAANVDPSAALNSTQ
ncbi:MAG TPA: ABC transporter permease [Candidatus Saccharimonadales bacterium]|nr:ABC transporter permease [Candidatus Saccharimonadales bacterium]